MIVELVPTPLGSEKAGGLKRVITLERGAKLKIGRAKDKMKPMATNGIFESKVLHPAVATRAPASPRHCPPRAIWSPTPPRLQLPLTSRRRTPRSSRGPTLRFGQTMR